MTNDDPQEARFRKIHEAFGDDPDMLTGALAASEELLDRYKVQAERYKKIAISAAHKIRSATEQSRKRGERIAKLRQDVIDGVAAHCNELKRRVSAEAELARVRIELDGVRELLAAKQAEYADHEARYRQLQEKVEGLGAALTRLYHDMTEPRPAEPAVAISAAAKPEPPLAAVLRIINGRPDAAAVPSPEPAESGAPERPADRVAQQ